MDSNTDTKAAPKFCITCAHIGTNASGNWETYRCFAPQNPSDTNLVTGVKEYRIPFCKDHRANSQAYINCGAAGTWYVAAPPKPAPTSIYDTTQSAADKLAAIKKYTTQPKSKGNDTLADLLGM